MSVVDEKPAMPHPLQVRLEQVRRRVRTLVVVHALAWLIGGMVATAIVFGLADYLVRFQDRGIRLMCTLMVLNVAIWSISRYLWPALNADFRDVDLALRVEKRFPELAERFASAVHFLAQPADDPTAGSAVLRREVVHETTALVAPLDLRQALDARHVRSAVLAAVAMCLAGAAICWASPDSSSIALRRLANPMGSVEWPKLNHLAFVERVGRVASGGRFEVELHDVLGAVLPRDVRIHYRFESEGAPASERVEAMRPLRDVMVASIDDVTRPFSYRAEGGDDDSMPWIALEVIEPPAIEQLDLKLHYPPYSGMTPAASEPHIAALVGTRVALTGKTTKPLRSALLRIEGGAELPLTLAADGYGFSLSADAPQPFVIERSGAYGLDLIDREGFSGGRNVRYDIRAIDDRPPTLSIEDPSQDTFVTAKAIVPVRVTAKDDLALRQIEMLVTGGEPPRPAENAEPNQPAAREDVPAQPAPKPAQPPEATAGEQSIAMFAGPDVPPAATPGESRGGESRTVEHQLDLGPLALKPGGNVSIRASASDYRPQVTFSHARRLTILTGDEFRERLADRQAAILGEIGRILKLQQESRSQVADLEIQLGQVGQLKKQDLDHLQQAELTQRQVDRGLGAERDGVQRRIKNLLSDLENNKVDNADVERRMSGLLDELSRLGKTTLPEIARELTSALKNFQAQGSDSSPDAKDRKAGPDAAKGDDVQASKEASKGATEKGQQQAGNSARPDKGSDQKQGTGSAKSSPGEQPAKGDKKPAPGGEAQPSPVAERSLAAAGQRQDEVIKSLEQMVSELNDWDNYRRFHREIGQLRRDEEQLAKETADLGSRTLSKDVKDLEPQQAADLKKLSQRQLEMARHFDKVQQRMEEAGRQLRESDPLAADSVADALEEAREQATASKMREAGNNIEQNQVGQAAGRQQQVMKQLDDLLDILANRRERELGRLVKKLREGEERLAQLRKDQEGLRKKLKQAAENPDEQARRRELERLSREQKQLQADTERLARTLKRLQAEEASRTASRGGAKMGQAGEQGEQGDGQQAAQQAEQAEQDLEDAQRQLAQQRRKAERDLANEQAARMQDDLKSMNDRQAKLLAETSHYDQLQQLSGKLSRAESLGVRDLARQQRALQQETLELAKKLEAAIVFDRALKNVARDMSAAGELLEQRQISKATQEAESHAIDRLAQMLKALSNERKPKKGGKQGGGEGQGGQSEQSGQEGIPSLAQLELLKAMQQELNDRTLKLDELRRQAAQLTPAEQQDYEALGEEQGQLADLLLELSKPEPEGEDLELDDMPKGEKRSMPDGPKRSPPGEQQGE